MVKSITLTASMRSNLNSLKNISKQMSTTQERLSTGKKVNSAIDNASSYYQARALTNRASDLDALLDAMGQGIQTIQAATQGLTSGVSFLEQASAIATEALAATKIPSKEWFEAQVGENGAVVTTAQELRDAINSGKETICVYGKITFETNARLNIKTSQKLVGINYFGDFESENASFSAIEGAQIYISEGAKEAEIAHLQLKYIGSGNMINGSSSGKILLHDLDISFTNVWTENSVVSAIEVSGQNSELFISNTKLVLVQTYKDTTTSGINLLNEAKLIVGANVDVIGNQERVGNNSAVRTAHWGQKNNAEIRITSEACFNVKGLNIVTNSSVIDSQNKPNRVIIEKGARLAVDDGTQVKYYRVKSEFVSTAYDTDEYIFAGNIGDKLDLEEIEPWETKVFGETKPQKNNNSSYADQYNKAFEQYDKLINDSSYQGVNLLKKEKLDVIFNETRNNKLTVQGQDMSSAALGLTKADWTTQGDIANSIQELLAAVNKIRTFQSELGNNYSIIQTRQNFTEALTDVLETGADNLVLADMNEESANYLALQTRQQLATNALSLAANSAQSVLALFG